MLVCTSSHACTEEGGGGGDVPAQTMFKTKYDKKSNLRNPLNGWVMYGSGSGDPSYWDTKYYVDSEAKEVKVSDYASAAYIRMSWATMNPADGVYAWRDNTTVVGKMIQGAIDRGLPIAFRFVVDGRDQRLNTPRFVLDAGAEYYIENPNYPDRITPFPQDPVFQQYYEKFITELAKDFNDPAKCSFIDAYGLGKWGEAHNVVYFDPATTHTSEEVEAKKVEVMNWVTDLYLSKFTKIPLVINYHRVVGHPASDGAANPNSTKILNDVMNKGYSLRHDAFGMTNSGWGYSTWEKAFARNWNYKRPVIMEGGYIVDSHSYWNDPAGYRQGHPEDVRKGEYDQSAEAKVNMMDFRVGSETRYWFQNAFDLVQKFISEGGYRLYPDQVSLPEEFKTGQKIKIVHRWRNMGWGYFPNNIPQWNYKYKVAFALLDAAGEVKALFIDEAAEPSEWLDSAKTYDFVTTAEAPAGKYTWGVAIVDTTDENKPAIRLAVNDEKIGDGWVKLLDVEVK